MSKKIAVLLIVGALIAGAVAGGYGALCFYIRFTGLLVLNSSAAKTATAVSTLSMLRAGNETNAVELLEIHLDGELVTLGACLADAPVSKRDSMCLGVLQQARDYRVKYPRQSRSRQGDMAVARAFALLNEKP